MDPEAALQAAKSALKSARKAGRHREGAHYEEAAEYLSNYWDWRRSGGFEPKNGDRRAEAMSEQLSEEWEYEGESGWGEAGGVIDEGYEKNPRFKLEQTGPYREGLYHYGPATIELSGPAGGRWHATVFFKSQIHDVEGRCPGDAMQKAMDWIDAAPELRGRASNPDTAAAKRRCMR